MPYQVTFFFRPFLIWTPIIFLMAIFGMAVWAHQSAQADQLKRQWFVYLAISVIVFRTGLAIFQTVAQHYVWANDPLTQVFLNSPVDRQVPILWALQPLKFLFDSSKGYFIFYALGRFWLNPLITIGAAFWFYLFLVGLGRYRPWSFHKGDKELGFLTALLVGWPQVVIFVPLIFGVVVGQSFIRLALFGQYYTRLTEAMLAACGISLLFGYKIIETLKLTSLKI